MTWKMGYEADIQCTSKSRTNWHVNQDWCRTSGKFWKNDGRPEFFHLFGGPKLPIIWTSEAHILHTSKMLAMSMWKMLMWNQWKVFEKMTKDRNFNLIEGSQWGFWGPYSTHHWKYSTYNTHVKQYWFETSENFLSKWPPKSRIFTCLGVQNSTKNVAFVAYIVHMSGSRASENIKQDWSGSRWHFFNKSRRADFWFIWRP